MNMIKLELNHLQMEKDLEFYLKKLIKNNIIYLYHLEKIKIQKFIFQYQNYLHIKKHQYMIL